LTRVLLEDSRVVAKQALDSRKRKKCVCAYTYAIRFSTSLDQNRQKVILQSIEFAVHNLRVSHQQFSKPLNYKLQHTNKFRCSDQRPNGFNQKITKTTLEKTGDETMSKCLFHFNLIWNIYIIMFLCPPARYGGLYSVYSQEIQTKITFQQHAEHCQSDWNMRSPYILSNVQPTSNHWRVTAILWENCLLTHFGEIETTVSCL
jgi:hypothetical protein